MPDIGLFQKKNKKEGWGEGGKGGGGWRGCVEDIIFVNPPE